ncbi:MAG: hypothetical protein CMP40_03295 [Rickettsiales bacterium]|nr:hypothetical protein [Rickettsiales bacterium]|tara:strand:- start:64 stop:825 length:762 start_codon:yes stop_codon:yes gene_type:complete
MMKKNNYYTATNLNKYTHGFFSKIGGVSKGIYTSLNCGLSSNDKKENVITNKKIIADTLNFNIEELIIGNQFHSNKISIIKDNKKLKYKCDGIICLSNNIALGVLTADCCPILIGHKNKKIMGVIHLGWKGLFDGIIENFLLETNNLDINSSDLIFALGPCIGKESYEVDIAFAKKFIEQESNYKKFFIKKNNSKYLFNIVGAAISRLKKKGVTDIWASNCDTFQQNKTFFSYRFSKINNQADYGRLLSVIKM